MNKKLLIAIGDSWTQGFGCYPLYILKKYGNPPIFPNWKNVTDENKKDMDFLHNEYMRKHSWCNILAKKINYDLVNLGRGGAANSTISKSFYNNVYHIDYSIYKSVLVIALLSSPSRISFFKNEDHIDFNFNAFPKVEDKRYNEFCEYFLTEIQNNYKDMCLETTFHLQAVESLCKSKGFNFYYATAFTDINDICHDKTYCINPENSYSYAKILEKNEIAKCNHPNEIGYIKIANVMYDELNKKGYEF